MDTVILEVTDAKTSQERFIQAWESGKPAEAEYISFATPELMWRVLSGKRLSILRAMTGAGEIGVRELARKVGRDVRAVHSDITALLNAGVIDRTEKKKLLFPYRHVKVQFSFDAEDSQSPAHHAVVQAPGLGEMNAA